MIELIRWQDRLVCAVDQALRTLTAPPAASRPSPAEKIPETDLTPPERRVSAELMRVNHAGEIAAQALYSGQSVLARSQETRRHLHQAADEERDHLAWCATRLMELDGRPSVLNPIWYGGSFMLGLIAGSLGDRISLGFIAETERQVEAHLQDHLERLPQDDARSAAVLQRMAEDEIHHGTTARLGGGVELPTPVRSLMAAGGELLRRTALLV